MIEFPGLGLNFNINKIAFQIFGIDIYYYAICIVLAIIIAMILCSKDKNNFGIKFDFVFENTIIAVIMGIIGARIYYVLFNFSEYSSDLMEVFKVWHGGLAIHGGIIAGLLTIIIYSKKYNVDIYKILDIFAPAL